MSGRRSAQLARALWAATLLLNAVGIALRLMAGGMTVGVLVGSVFAGAAGLGSSTLGLLIVTRRPGNTVGWIFLGVGAFWGLSELAGGYASFAVGTDRTSSLVAQLADWSGQWNWMPPTFLAPALIALLFPDGHPLTPRWRPVVWVGVLCTTVIVLSTALAPGPMEDPLFLKANPFGIEGAASLINALGIAWFPMLVVLAASIASLAIRLRRARGEEREQMKWLAFGLGVAVVAVAAGSVIDAILNAGSRTVLGSIVIGAILFALSLIPITAAIAILKYRLYDIDVVINKAVVYGALALFITLVYVAFVAGIGTAIGSRRNPLLAGIAAAVIAVAFQPARRSAQHLANRLVYGTRATPYEVLSEFSERLASAYSIDDVLPRMARILAEGTGAARARIWLRDRGEVLCAATWPGSDTAPALALVEDGLPEFPGGERAFPVLHQGELLGAVSLAMPPGDSLTPVQAKLSRDVAGQAGLVLRNVRLVGDLRASRQRLVAAQDEERRRIERNIHDGAQQQLVALTVKVRLAEGFIGRDARKERDMLEQVRAELTEALDDLRDLARGIYPPLLADKGLAAALEAQARKVAVPVTIEANGVGRYPQEIEAAAYFCCLEALQNVAKYADASSATIRLRHTDDTLTFSVEDAGQGFDPATTSRGSGLTNMADRLEVLGGSIKIRSELGSGTAVTGRVPARALEPSA